MANNRIQIKRSATTATPTSLLPGELAFSNVTGGSGVLFIGDTSNSAVVAIGGVRNPGTLTANQALVANSTSAINQVIVGNLVFTGTTQTISANNFRGNAGEVLVSGGSANAYWAPVSALSGSVNTAAQYTWTNTHTFQNTITFGANLIVDTTSLRWVGNPTTSPTITLANTGSFTIGNSSTTQTTGQILVQNTAGLTTINAGSIQTTTVFANVSGTTGTFTGLVNASALNVVNQTNTATLFVTTSANVGTAFTVTSSQVTTAVNTSLSSGALTTNSTVINGTVYVNATGFSTTGNANAGTIFVTGSVNATTVNTTSLYATGLVNAANFSTTGNANAGTVYVTGSVNATTVNTTSLYATGLVNAANFSTTGNANAGTVYVTGSVNATTVNSTSVYATGLVNAANFSTTGNANATNHYAGPNTVLNATNLLWTGNPTTSPTITLANTGAFSIGNSTTTQTTSIITVANSSGNVQITPTLISGNGNGITSLNATQVTSGTLPYSVIPANIVNTTASFTLSGNTTLAGTNTTISSNLNMTGTFANLAGNIANSSGLYSVNVVNAAVHSVGTSFTANSTLVNAAAINITGQVNTATLFVTTSANLASSNVIANTAGLFVANATGVVNAAVHSVGTTFIANSTKVTFTGANIDATSAVFNIRDINATGNLIVSGTVTYIDSTTIAIKDNVIFLGDQIANTTGAFTDNIDTGFFTAVGNTQTTLYSGFSRIAALSTNSNPYFKIFQTGTVPGATTIDASANIGTLQAYLQPYGTGTAFVANSLAVTITANSTVNVNITANSLTLSTPLAGTSGGTGRASWTNQDLLVANATNGINALALNTIGGYVLQTNGTAIVYDFLDGGTF